MKIHSLADTTALGARFALGLKPGQTVLLKGELGVGKTEFARAIIRAWMGDQELEVPSPSFTLVQSYQHGDQSLNHFDLYRLSTTDELVELGVPEIFDDTISLIEWPERLGDLAPLNAITVEITDLGGDAREFKWDEAHG